MKNTRPFAIKTRVLSFILTLLLIFYTIPATVFAEVLTVGTDETQVLTDTAENFDPEAAREIYEVEELREENAKHFRLEDGSYLAASYVDPVHYLDEDGKWQDIDNRLFSVNGEFSTSNARVKFAKKITGNENLFTLHDGNAKITMGLLGAKKQTEGKVTTDYLSDDNEETKLGKMTNLEKLTSVIVYENILDGTDLEYIVKSNYIKENIIVKERKESYNYFFNLKLNNLKAELSDDGSVKFIDDVGEVSYIIPAPFVYDDNNETADSIDAYFTLTENKNGSYLLGITVSSAWMNAEERAYPVTIDPTIATDLSTVTDLYIDGSNPSSNYNTSTTLKVGSNKIAYWKASTLPTLPAGYYIVDASLSLYSAEYLSNKTYIGVHKANVNISADSTWNSRNTSNYGLSTTIEDYNAVQDIRFYYWDITDTVRGWYSGQTNYGVGFQIVSGTSTLYTAQFYSNDHVYKADKPLLQVNYRSMLGAEDYWSFNSHSVGVAGDGAVNLANGNLLFSVAGLTTTDSVMPVSVGLIYNSALANKAFDSSNTSFAFASSYMPLGYKLNIQETVIYKGIPATNSLTRYVYLYTDADGTEHQFYTTTDENGKGFTLKKSGATLTITDRDKTVRTFTQIGTSDAWYLSKITNKLGNSVIIEVDSSHRPTSVKLQPKGISTPIEMLTLEYKSGKLAMIRNKTSGDAAIFKYSDTYNGSISSTATKYLRQVDYVNAKNASDTNLNNYYSSGTTTNITVNATISYSYNSAGKLITAKNNMDGRYVGYTYSGTKVTAVKEYDGGGSLGQQISITYSDGYSRTRTSGGNDIYGDSDDIYTNYIFDKEGRCVSTYSTNSIKTEIYGATSGKYETQANVKNNLKETVDIGGSSTNLLLNGDFEKWSSSKPLYWETSSANISSSAVNYTSNFYEARIMVSAGQTHELYQYVYLPEGSYTASLNYNVSNFEKAHLYIKVTPISGGTVNSKELAKDATYETDYMTESLAFEVTSDGTYKISVVAVGETAQTTTSFAYIDNFVLTEGASSAPFNFVDGGHFTSSHRNASGGIATSATSLWTMPTGSTIALASSPYDEVLQVQASISSTREAKQRIYEAHPDLIMRYDYYPSDFVTNANRSFVVSAMGYSSTPVASGATFEIRVDVYYYQGTGNNDFKVSHSFPFQNIDASWQFVSGTFDGAYSEDTVYDYSCIHYIDVACVYSNQASGYALFDNVSVNDRKEYTGYLYGYYSNGLLEKKTGFYSGEYYAYDANYNLIQKANDRGEIFVYEYDSGNQLVKEVYYTFVNGGGTTAYPYWLSNPNSYITVTPVRMTENTYNSYGLLTESKTAKCDFRAADDPTVIFIGSNVIRQVYEYYEGSGSKIFGALKSSDDYVSDPIFYFRDETNGRLLATLQDGVGSTYTYDAMGRIVGVKPATGNREAYSTVTNAENVNYTYNSAGELSSISTDSTTYTFIYDGYGNTDTIDVGGSQIVDYEYYPNNGKLKKIIYANGFAEEYFYDSLDRLSEICYHYSEGSSQTAVRYFYTTEGLLQREDDLLTGRSRVYVYNTAGQVKEIGEFDTDDLLYDRDTLILYDTDGRIASLTETIDYISNGSIKKAEITNHYFYANDGRLTSSYISFGTRLDVITYTYDLLNRVSKLEYASNTSNGFENLNEYTYINSSYDSVSTSGQVTGHVSSVFKGSSRVSLNNYSYEYDDRGNITHIVQNGYNVYYHYDDLGQLVREDNELLGETYELYYDNAGNIEAKLIYPYTTADSTSGGHDTNIYHYDNSAWGDQLTMFDNDITYDAIGNPINYYNGFTFGWSGRQLITATKGSNSYTFVYNSDGLRVQKTVNGVVHKYYYSGTQLLAEEWGNNLIIFLYDGNGLPLGMKYRTTSYASSTFDTYWYERNLQGDIVAIFGDNGTKYATYRYDAWGNQTVSYSNGGANIVPVTNNPLRYRGYYYDTDLGLYYLQTRYYDSCSGRFINADIIDVVTATPMALTDKNLYAYCDNNPVMRVDEDGEFWNVFVGGLVGAGIGFITAVVSEMLDDGLDWDKDLDNILISTGIGAIEGAAMALFPGSTVLIGMASGVADATINGIAKGDDVKSIAIDSVVSGAFGAIGGAGGTDFVKGGKLINDAFGSIGNAVRKGVHPVVKKAATKTIKKAFRYTQKSFASGVIEGVSYSALEHFTSQFVNSLVGR